VKGHDLFLRAAALVLEEHPETRFSIAGDVLEPDYYQQLEGLVRDLGLGDRFQFTGGVRDTLQHLQQADLFVLPSRSEGFSNAILEAMACGLPVIATDVGGNAEAVQDGVNGFVIKAEDTKALAARICTLAGDRDEARRLGAAGRLLAETRFSTGAMMRQISSAYRELIAGL
jgi:glycosyltransferase involved in cell wall biosynthesis